MRNLKLATCGKGIVNYNAGLKDLLDRGKYRECRIVFNNMIFERIRPDRLTFQLLTLALTKTSLMGYYYSGIEVYRRMRYLAIPIEPKILLKLIAMDKRNLDYRKWLDLIYEAGIIPNVEIFNQFLKNYARDYDEESCKECFMYMIKKGVKPDEITYSALMAADVQSGNYKKINGYLNDMYNIDYERQWIAFHNFSRIPNRIIALSLMNAIFNAGMGFYGLKLHRLLKASDSIEPEKDLILMKFYCKNCAFTQSDELYQQMLRERSQCSKIYRVYVEHLFLNRRMLQTENLISKADVILNNIKEVYGILTPYTVMFEFIRGFAEHNPQKALLIFYRELRRKNIGDVSAYVLFSKLSLKRLKSAGPGDNSKSFEVILSRVYKQFRHDAPFYKYLSPKLYELLIFNYLNLKSVSKAVEIFHDMLMDNVAPSAELCFELYVSNIDLPVGESLQRFMNTKSGDLPNSHAPRTFDACSIAMSAESADPNLLFYFADSRLNIEKNILAARISKAFDIKIYDVRVSMDENWLWDTLNSKYPKAHDMPMYLTSILRRFCLLCNFNAIFSRL